jgi:hypothetical protein
VVSHIEWRDLGVPLRDQNRGEGIYRTKIGCGQRNLFVSQLDWFASQHEPHFVHTEAKTRPSDLDEKGYQSEGGVSNVLILERHD